jgi:muconate cycloisomerase
VVAEKLADHAAMTVVRGFELFAVDLPFRVSFKHSAAERRSSDSLFLRCILDDGTEGWGESLPRAYVTGESRDTAFDVLATGVLPALAGLRFSGLDAAEDYLSACDGHPVDVGIARDRPLTAAWCAVDLALLDAFGRASGQRVLSREPSEFPGDLRYSGVLSAEVGLKKTMLLIAHRVMGFRALKLKVGPDTGGAEIASLRRWLGARMDLRADANMGWTVEQAARTMTEWAPYGVRFFEQPLPAHDLDGLASLVAETRLDVMADESFSTRESLEALVRRRAATAVNARISKCGGLMATLRRCREALAAGLHVQIGCQVGESSLLSAAHLRLCAAIGSVKFAEGCFGTLLLREDPARPELRFGRGGRPPPPPAGPGLGVELDAPMIVRHARRRMVIGPVEALR